MREIKFRVWQSKSINHDNKMWKIEELPNGMLESLIQEQSLKKGILMQYTGLKDKNGKEIYEGDIINWTTEDVNDVVRFKDGTFMIGDVCSFNVSVSNLEVIGNIYENPDLLK